LTRIRLRTGIAVVTRGAVISWRIRARTRHGITGARDMALILGHAGNRRPRRAHAHLTRVHRGTEIAVRTCGAIGDIRMTWNTRRTSFRGAGIAIIERQIGVISDVDELAIAVANMLQTVVVGLRSGRSIFRREIHAANAVGAAGALAAFVVGSWTIRRCVASDALTHVVTHERVTIAIHAAIGSLRQIRIRRHASRTDVIRTSIAVVRQVRVVVVVNGCAIAITNRNLAITRRLGRYRRVRGDKVESAHPRRTRASLARIIHSRTIIGDETLHASTGVVALRAAIHRACRAHRNRRIGWHTVDTFIDSALVHIIDRHADRAAAAAARTASTALTTTAAIANLRTIRLRYDFAANQAPNGTCKQDERRRDEPLRRKTLPSTHESQSPSGATCAPRLTFTCPGQTSTRTD